MGECKSEKFLPNENPTQTSARSELAAKVRLNIQNSLSLHFHLNRFCYSKMFSLICSQIFSWRCCWWFSRWHYSRFDGYSTSSCLFGNRWSSCSRKCIFFALIKFITFESIDFHCHSFHSVRSVWFIFGMLCVYHSWLKQRCTDGTNGNRCIAHIPSGRWCMAACGSSVIFNRCSWNANGSIRFGFSHQFCVRTSEFGLHECRCIDYFNVAS